MKDRQPYSNRDSRIRTWRDSANRYLLPLFLDGRQPTRKEIKDAYPFGQRKYHPYKVWLEQVAWFKAGCPDKPYHPKAVTVPQEQGALPL